MPLDREKEKLFNVIIYFLKNTKHCYKLKLLKLLYFLDFAHYKQTGRSVTGLKYYAWEMGPVATDIYHALSEPEKIDGLQNYISSFTEEYGEEGKRKLVIKPKLDFNSKIFSKREIRLLTTIAEIFSDAKADVMTEASHFPSLPWKKTIETKGESQLIDYDLVIDGKKETISLERLNEIKSLNKEALAFLSKL